MSAKQNHTLAAEHIDGVPVPDTDTRDCIADSREAINGDGLHSLSTLIANGTLDGTGNARVTPPSALLSASGVFDVYVEEGLLSDIDAALDTYVLDLAAEGYNVSIQEFSGTAADLRQTLHQRWESALLEGALLIGDLPVVEFDHVNRFGDDVYHSKFAHDLYFMDLDGTYDLSSGFQDMHVGDVAPEIYISRLLPSTVTGLTGKSEAQLINAYFDKVHSVRTGDLTYEERGLMFLDDDWQNGFAGDLDGLYSTVTEIRDPALTTRDAFLDVLSAKAESLFEAAHSSPTGHDIDGIGGGAVSSSEVLAANPQSGFINMFNCKAGRFTEPGNLIGTYVFGSDSIVNAIGSSKTGGMLNLPDFYDPQGDGRSIGQAYLDWFDLWAGATDEPLEDQWKVSWHYGMTMMGDPTLRPDAITAQQQPLRVEAEDFVRDQGFKVKSLAGASNDDVLQADGTGLQIAHYDFFNAAGTYDLDVGYFDENDGVSSFSVLVDGVELANWVWDQELGSPLANNLTKTTFGLYGVSLETGSRIQVIGQKDGGEPLRFDYLDISPAADILPPQVQIASGYFVGNTQAGSATNDVEVTYSDNVALDVSSFDPGDIQVVGPDGTTLDVLSTTVGVPTDGSPRKVVYEVGAPGGSWDTVDNGLYAVSLLGSEVFDTSSNAALPLANIAEFPVSIDAPTAFRVEAEDFIYDQGFNTKPLAAASNDFVLQADGLDLQRTHFDLDDMPNGNYTLKVGYFDENDGVSEFAVFVDGVEQDSWLWDKDLGSPLANNLTKTTHAINNVDIASGARVEVRGYKDGSEPLRFDYIDFIPAPQPAVRVEAEDFTQEIGFKTKSLAVASNNKVLQADGLGGQSATHSFAQPSGIYDVLIGYFDENDGESSLALSVDGAQVDEFIWNKDLGSPLADEMTMTTRLIEDVGLETGDEVGLFGFRGGDEPLRIDYLEFIFVDDLLV